jgi:hypothetical protein
MAPGHGRPLSGGAAATELAAYARTHGLMQAGSAYDSLAER